MTLRKELFVPAYRWTQPTGDEVHELIDYLGMTEHEVALLLGLKPSKVSRGNSTVSRWKMGKGRIPYAAWALLAHKAGYGCIWV